MRSLDELQASGARFVGFFGYPPRSVLEEWVARTGAEPLDLDPAYGAPPSHVVPETCCRIIENIVANALALEEQLAVVVGAVGPDKCDNGRYAAWLLARLGVAPVVETENRAAPPPRQPAAVICGAKGPLRPRVDRIMESVVHPLTPDEIDAYGAKSCRPTHGFWGVPPSNPAVLDLFPDTTALYGWVRCVEAGAPADLELECTVDAGVPTVFFVQTFCHKALLARRLADEHDGLLVDVHDRLTGSVAAKIEAFIELTRAR